MLPLCDLHVHLLAGLDDGPKTPEIALAMCRLLAAEGVRYAAAVAHQNPRYPDNLPPRLQTAGEALIKQLKEAKVDLTVFPSGEVMVEPDIAASLAGGKYQSIGGRGKYILIEMPEHRYVDIRPILRPIKESGLRPILAHPEQCPELLHEQPEVMEDLVRLGCLIQVSSDNITKPGSPADARALKAWFRRGLVHVLGSDGHSVEYRPPHLRAAYEQVVRWAGSAVADSVGHTHGLAILNGLPFHPPPVQPRQRSWFAWLWH